jgi:uncharacterized protein DUF4325
MLDYKISDDFTDTPGGRYRRIGDYSGEQFREEVLERLLRDNKNLVIDLDDTEGYPSSFLEESFGGLVRAGFSVDDLKTRLKLVARDPAFEFYISEIWEYIEKAGQTT